MVIDVENVHVIEESSVTARGYRHRTTIPSNVFRLLNLKDKDRLKWILLKNGTLIVRKVALEDITT